MNNPYNNRFFMPPPPPPQMQHRQNSYQQDPALIATVVQFYRQAQSQGRSIPEIQQALHRSSGILNQEQSNASSTCTKLIIGLIITVLAGVIASVLFSSSTSLKKLPKVSGITDEEREQLSELLLKKQIDMKEFETGYWDSPIEKRDTAKINAVVESAYQFIVVAQTESINKKMVFGAYVNRRKLKDSFIFSLNHKTILPVDRPQMAWQINPRSDSGPRFGKSDLQFFVFKSGNYDSMSNLCYNYICPPGIVYGTEVANQYLAGSEIFLTHSFTVLVNNREDL